MSLFNPGNHHKYKKIIYLLKSNIIYSPASIADLAETKKLLNSSSSKEALIEKNKLRITMSRVSLKCNFPKDGDGILSQPGNVPRLGWLGSRWQSVLIESNKS